MHRDLRPHGPLKQLNIRYFARKRVSYSQVTVCLSPGNPTSTSHLLQNALLVNTVAGEDEFDMRGPQYDTQESCDVNCVIGAPCIAWCGCAPEKVSCHQQLVVHCAYHMRHMQSATVSLCL
jgi:hypothetical protein